MGPSLFYPTLPRKCIDIRSNAFTVARVRAALCLLLACSLARSLSPVSLSLSVTLFPGLSLSFSLSRARVGLGTNQQVEGVRAVSRVDELAVEVSRMNRKLLASSRM